MKNIKKLFLATFLITSISNFNLQAMKNDCSFPVYIAPDNNLHEFAGGSNQEAGAGSSGTGTGSSEPKTPQKVSSGKNEKQLESNLFLQRFFSIFNLAGIEYCQKAWDCFKAEETKHLDPIFKKISPLTQNSEQFKKFIKQNKSSLEKSFKDLQSKTILPKQVFSMIFNPKDYLLSPINSNDLDYRNTLILFAIMELIKNAKINLDNL